MADVLIRGAVVLDPGSPLAVADIAVRDGVVISVGDTPAPGAGTRVIDATGRIAMPGLVNAHTHSGQHLDRGVAPNLPLDLWLMWVVYGGVQISADDAYTLAMAGAVEMLESGCTAVLDHAWVPADGFDEHIDAIVAAYADSGIRAGLAPMIEDRDIFESMSFDGLDRPAPMAEPGDPARLLAAMERFLTRHAGRQRFVAMVGPSAPQRCSDELLAGLAGLAGTWGAPFHTHVLETRTQIVATRRRYGRSVVDVLADLGVLGGRTSLAHCVWMDSGEYTTVRDTAATVVHNPMSNLRAGSGLLPLAGLLAGGVSVAVGADGAASNDNQNMFEALKTATLLPTLTGDFRDWPTAGEVWGASLAGGAAALGSPIGRIAPGHRADIVLLTGDRHVATDHEALVRSLVFAERGESVDTVLVDGEVVVEHGRCTRVPAGHAARARALQERIHASIPGRRAVLDRYAPVLGAVHDRAMATPVGIERHAAITPAFDPHTAEQEEVGARG